MKFLISWHFLSIIIALIIGSTNRNYNLFYSLLIWTCFIIIVFQLKIQGKYYFFATIFISLIEEIIVYSFGGGLQGTATSLIDDLTKAMPVFLAMSFSWYYALKTYKFTISDLYILTGLQGIFLELVISGAILNPLALILLGGPVFFIYGTIYTSPLFPESKDQDISVINMIIIWIVIILLMILSAIVIQPILRYIFIKP